MFCKNHVKPRGSDSGTRHGIGLTSFLTAALLLPALVQITGCATIQTDLRYDSPRELNSLELEQLELELVMLRAQPDQARLEAARSVLQEKRQNQGSDPLLAARTDALAAEAALQAGRNREAQNLAASARTKYPGEELVALVESRLIGDLEQRIAFLQGALQSSDSGFRLKAELGQLLLENGKYREALAAFDTALPRLPQEYGVLYSASREKAWALRDSEGAVEAASDRYLTGEPISLLGMIVVTQQESGLLDWYTGGANWAPGVIFERTKGASWYVDPASKAEQAATRADAALFVWNLLARGRVEALTPYRVRYASRGTSPIPDVPYDHPAFDAVLGLVEEEIMQLHDGRSFLPDQPISGLQFFGVLTAAIRLR